MVTWQACDLKEIIEGLLSDLSSSALLGNFKNPDENVMATELKRYIDSMGDILIGILTNLEEHGGALDDGMPTFLRLQVSRSLHALPHSLICAPILSAPHPIHLSWRQLRFALSPPPLGHPDEFREGGRFVLCQPCRQQRRPRRHIHRQDCEHHCREHL